MVSHSALSLGILCSIQTNDIGPANMSDLKKRPILYLADAAGPYSLPIQDMTLDAFKEGAIPQVFLIVIAFPLHYCISG